MYGHYNIKMDYNIVHGSGIQWQIEILKAKK